jgi:IS30 family transposase
MSDTRLKDTRVGINSTEEEFASIIDIVKPLLKAGLGLDAIWCAHKDELGISKRTFYRWADLGLGICNLELPKKVAYRPRKKKQAEPVTRPDLAGREYSDFAALSEEMRTSAIEMDCVVGLKSDRQVILTLLHRRTNFQFGVLLARHDATSVVAALDWVESVCAGRFKQLFSVILTDRGTEFSDVAGMEMGANGKRRCRVYFCDPQRPDQKGSCERAHVDLRKILPKRITSFDNLTSWDIAKAFSHLNSVPRPALSGATPMALAQAVFPKEFFDELGLAPVAIKDICLRPGLIDGKEAGA